MHTWIEESEKLYKTFTFGSYLKNVEFATKAAQEAETFGHHPTITITYNEVRIETTTHSQGNTVTDKDHQLATIIDNILKK